MKLFRQKLTFSAAFGLVVTGLFLLVVLFAPWIAPFGEAETVGGTWDPASSLHWLGTDQIGRDMLTRILYGTRMTIAVALAIGLAYGAIAGYAARQQQMPARFVRIDAQAERAAVWQQIQAALQSRPWW